jgi:protein BUR2
MPSFREPTPQNGSPSLSKNLVLEKTQSQWLFTAQELMLAPSIIDGMPVAQELANRQKGVNFITQVGIMLKLPQLTLATAAVYLHRFFMRHAMVQNNKPGLHHYSVAATAIFLATKVEENYRKMRELVVACCRVAQKQPNLVIDDQSKEYWKWRDTILHNEDLLLEALCFDLQLEQPYRILLDFLRYYDVQANKQLRNTSWAFLNDSLVTTMCLQLPPAAIAGSALYMGVKFAGITLPDDERGRPWWEQLGLDLLEIQRGCRLMAEVYENPALPRQGQKDAYTGDDDLGLFDRTRHAGSPQPDRSPTASVRSGSQGVKRDRDGNENSRSGDWGVPASLQPRSEQAESAPSPKRFRRDSREDVADPIPRSLQQKPPNSADRGQSSEPASQGDEVQRRIDEIVGASSSRVPPPSLARRPSGQASQNSWQPQLSGRQSSSSSHIPDTSFHSNGHSDRDRPLSGGREGLENAGERQADGHGRDRVPSRIPALPANGPPSSRPMPPSNRNGVDDIDDAEKVDYGSEEGEL